MYGYNLINSKAISEYCKKIKHEFNTEELAVLIFRNKNMSIDEKISAYKELIKEYPDMEVIERINCNHYDSVKTMIENEIKRLKNMVDFFHEDTANSIYTFNEFNKYAGKYLDTNEIDDARGSFKEIEKAIYNYIEEYDTDNEITSFRIKKVSLKDKNLKIFAIYKVENKKLILTNIYDVNDYLDIDNIFLNIPNPFKIGDILTDGNKIMVLEWLCTQQEDLEKLLAKGCKDSSDMQGTCYFIDDYNTLYWDNVFDYDSWEYFDGDLEGLNRLLKPVSSFLKNEISPDLFLNACDYIRTKSDGNWNLFSSEGLERIGLDKKEILNLK